MCIVYQSVVGTALGIRGIDAVPYCVAYSGRSEVAGRHRVKSIACVNNNTEWNHSSHRRTNNKMVNIGKGWVATDGEWWWKIASSHPLNAHTNESALRPTLLIDILDCTCQYGNTTRQHNMPQVYQLIATSVWLRVSLEWLLNYFGALYVDLCCLIDIEVHLQLIHPWYACERNCNSALNQLKPSTIPMSKVIWISLRVHSTVSTK